MHTFQVSGDVRSALTHFALQGLAQIARSISNESVCISWTSEAIPHATLHTESIEISAIAQELRDTAARWAEGWTSRRYKYGGGEFSPFSPRFKLIDSERFPQDWTNHQKIRCVEIDRLSERGDVLALKVIQGLGEPAYWTFEPAGPRPDHGASRWEMKTRNRGEEFVSHRLFPLCVEVAKWPIESIVAGLEGNKITDNHGDGKDDSRSSSGFTPPGPTDNALALATLIGLASFPVSHRIGKVSVTPGAFPDNVLHTTVMVLPVPDHAISIERFENVVISESWSMVTDEFGQISQGKDPNPLEFAPHHESLKSRSIPAAAVFTVRKAGSDSAPERYIEQGRVQLL